MFKDLINRFFTVLPYSFEFILLDFYEKLIQNFRPCWQQVDNINFRSEDIRPGDIIYVLEGTSTVGDDVFNMLLIKDKFLKVLRNKYYIKAIDMDNNEYRLYIGPSTFYRYDSFYNIKKPIKRISKIRG